MVVPPKSLRLGVLLYSLLLISDAPVGSNAIGRCDILLASAYIPVDGFQPSLPV